MAIVAEMSWDDILDGKPFPQSDARRLFFETVSTVFVQAKEALPHLNGRVEKARDLVLASAVVRNQDGSFTVQSQCAPGKHYTVNGSSCTCPDAQNREIQCKHIISTWLWRKARKVIEQQQREIALPQLPSSVEALVPAQKTGAPVTHTEAPASVNCYVTLAGRQIQLTLRDQNEQRLLQRLETLLQQFPVVAGEEKTQDNPPEGWCSKHNVQMRLNHGKKGSWWSHKTQDGQWCNKK